MRDDSPRSHPKNRKPPSHRRYQLISIFHAIVSCYTNNMKEHFGPALEKVNFVAKENPSRQELEQKLDEELKSVPLSDRETLADMIPEAARVKVFELQQEKRKILEWLHDRLADIDKGKPIEGFEKKENSPH